MKHPLGYIYLIMSALPQNAMALFVTGIVAMQRWDKGKMKSN